MSATGLEVFDKTIHETNIFVKIVMRELETDDRRLAFGALRGTLHALRDILDLPSAAHLSAQLPMLLRGLFYEDWTGSARPVHARTLPEFLDLVSRHLPPQLQRYAEESVRAGLVALAERIEGGECEKLVAHVPHGLRGLWPGAVADASTH